MHGVATATAAALFGLTCRVYMGTEDIRRQELNVFRMRAMGAEVFPVESGSKTLKDATNEAMREWMSSVEDTHYIIGSVVGPHPFPAMVRDFQSVIGTETKEQSVAQFGKLPDVVVACVGGGSNAAGMFYPFVDDAGVELVGVEAGGRGKSQGDHAATLSNGKPGVLHGSFSYVLQDDDGQTADVHQRQRRAGLPRRRPGTQLLARRQPCPLLQRDGRGGARRLPPVRPARRHPARARNGARGGRRRCESRRSRSKDDVVVVCFSGRGDKDCAEVARLTAKK